MLSASCDWPHLFARLTQAHLHHTRRLADGVARGMSERNNGT